MGGGGSELSREEAVAVAELSGCVSRGSGAGAADGLLSPLVSLLRPSPPSCPGTCVPPTRLSS